MQDDAGAEKTNAADNALDGAAGGRRVRVTDVRRSSSLPFCLSYFQ
jgi:hypothetical protein